MGDVCSAFVTITDLYDGENGRGIASTSYLYIANDSSSAPAASSLDWTTWANAYADFGINNRYFWQKETITYTDGQNPEVNVWLLSTYVKGDPGINGVSYWVDKSASIISKDTNNSDTLTPSSVNLTAMKNEGGTTAVFTAGTIKVWAGTDTSGTPYAQTTSSSGGVLSFNARAADTIYTIKLYNGSNVELDTETVPVVATGINATQYYSYLRYSPVASPTDNDWTVTPDSSTRYIGTYAGTTPISSLHANNFSWSKYIGDDATQFYTYVRYSAYDDGRDYSTTPNDYVGIYVGTESSPPAASNIGWHWTKFVGDPGTNAVVAVLTNDSAQVPTDKDGNVPAGTVYPSTTIELYSGATKITTVTYPTLTSTDYSGCTISQSNGTVTIASMIADYATVNLKVTYNTVTYSKQFTVTRQKQGLTGSQGPQGETGAQGPQGETGAQGPQGEKGDTGAQGPQGEKGDKGDTGVQGPQGEKGDKGDTGETGPQGPQGETGPQGPQGETGATGSQGPSGTPAYVFDFKASSSSYKRNMRLASPAYDTTITLTADIQGYSDTAYWSVDHGTLSASSGSLVILSIPPANNYDTITITMGNASSSPTRTYIRMVSAVDETEYEHYFGPCDDSGDIASFTDSFGRTCSPISGDYFVCVNAFGSYTKGKTYEYGSSSWSEMVSNSSSKASKFLNALNSLKKVGQDLSQLNDPNTTSWFTDIIVDTLIANKLFAQAITIMTGGHIMSGTRYTNAGVIQNWNADGFWFGSDGRLMAQLQSDDATNTFVGTKVSGATNSVGEGNTAMGYKAMYNNTTGCKYNTAIGYEAMYTDAGSRFNVAIGYMALYSATTNGNNNVGIGYKALYKDSTGYDNVAIGFQTMYNNTTGRENVALGSSTLYLNTTGSHNVSVGYMALTANTTGWRNIAIGANALDAHKSGNDDIAVGVNALTNDSTGYQNVGIGANTLNATTTGHDNTALGHLALSSVTTGTYNLGLGHDALDGLTTGSYNIGLGYKSAPYSVSGSRQININDALICLEFKAGRTYGQIYTVLKAYLANSTDDVSCIGIAEGTYAHRISVTDSSTITLYSGYILEFSRYSSTTLTKRMVLFFVNPKLSSNTSADCIG